MPCKIDLLNPIRRKDPPPAGTPSSLLSDAPRLSSSLFPCLFQGLFLGLSLLFCACPSSPDDARPDDATPGDASAARLTSPSKPASAERLPSPLLPRKSEAFSPSLVQVQADEGSSLGAAALTLEASKTCQPCHSDIADEWKDSVHAFSSFNNPLYRMAFDQFTTGATPGPANFCAGCHDPALLVDGSVLKPIAADNPAAHAGITCITCHSIQDAQAEGNGSYTLRLDPIPLPRAGDAASLQAHKARVASPALRTEALCVSCHRGILSQDTGHPAVLLGLDEWGPHRRSAFGNSGAGRISPDVQPQTCVDCHMPPQGGERPHRSHRFPGGHSSLAAMMNARAQQDAIANRLSNISRVEILPSPPLQTPQKRQALRFDVLVFNTGAGHRFPGGAKDLRDTWLQLELTDARGVLLAEAGRVHQRGEDDASTHSLNALVTDSNGNSEREHRVSHFRTPAYDNTLQPRDGTVVRYEWQPTPEQAEGLTFPLELRVALRHRRLTPSFYAATCTESQTPRGKAFLETTARLWKRRLEPCIEQPVLELAQARVTLEALTAPIPSPPAWDSWYRHGLALEHQVQERLDEAQTSLEAAWTRLPPDAAALDRARVRLEQGRVSGEQGRTDEALERLAEAEALAPGHPAIAFARGDALARVWRWALAAPAYEAAARGAPRDDRTWRALALARGSAGDARGALEAAQAGLRIEPRDPQLLRSQALAYRHLRPDDSETAAALNTYLTFRTDDDAPDIRSRCGKQSPDCERERRPVHVHRLNTVGAN